MTIQNKNENKNRINKLYAYMNKKYPQWDIVIIADEMNQYYYAGSIQNGVLVFLRNGDVHYFVKKSYARAKLESSIESIHQINSYRDIASVIGSGYANGYLELGKIPVKMFQMMNKHLNIENTFAIDNDINYLRSAKSEYELELMRIAGKGHRQLLEEVVPTLLREGMTEFDFVADFNYAMSKLGHYGTTRFNMFNPPLSSGQLSFGDNSTYPTNFDGPGGLKGQHPSIPYYGDRQSKLTKGDLIFVDVGFCIEGYNTDKTQIYSFGCEPSDSVMDAHRECMRLQKMTADMLITGEIPSNIYKTVTDTLDSKYKDCFMGGYEQVKFIGHGTGLYINEFPVIAKGFDQPLERGMTLAIEPKIALLGTGTVGVEDTYVVGDTQSECITGGGIDIIRV